MAVEDHLPQTLYCRGLLPQHLLLLQVFQSQKSWPGPWVYPHAWNLMLLWCYFLEGKPDVFLLCPGLWLGLKIILAWDLAFQQQQIRKKDTQTKQWSCKSWLDHSLWARWFRAACHGLLSQTPGTFDQEYLLALGHGGMSRSPTGSLCRVPQGPSAVPHMVTLPQ